MRPPRSKRARGGSAISGSSLTAYHIGHRFPARIQGLLAYSSKSVFALPALRPARLATRTSAAIPARLAPQTTTAVSGSMGYLLPITQLMLLFAPAPGAYPLPTKKEPNAIAPVGQPHPRPWAGRSRL